MSGTKKTKESFETAFKKLESIVEVLEKGDSPLDDAMHSFEEGMELIKFCTEKLNDAETRLMQLVKDESGNFRLEHND